MRLFAAVILSSTAAVLGSAATAGAAPANDSFAAAAPIAGAEGAHVGTTLGATKEAGEPSHAGNAGGHSVWHVWTAPETGMFVFSTTFSSFDTLLAVYTGSEVSGLAEVASNDDAVGFDTTRSRVAFPASEGTTYAIAVDGFGGKTGRSELRWRRGQANDLFASPEVIEGPAGSLARANTGATIETSEPSPWNSTASVWFAWTAPASGTVKFSTTANNVDTVIGVYTGTTLEDLTTIATNDDDPVLGCCGSFVGFEAVAGTAYRIAVGGYGSDEGTFTLSWSPLIFGTASADTLTGTPGTEEIRAFGGNDVLNGLGGDDILIGGPGHDRSFGGGGADVIVDQQGRDLLNGGAGADFLLAIDGRPGDTLNGGPGRDTCHGDRTDSRRRCP